VTTSKIANLKENAQPRRLCMYMKNINWFKQWWCYCSVKVSALGFNK